MDISSVDADKKNTPDKRRTLYIIVVGADLAFTFGLGRHGRQTRPCGHECSVFTVAQCSFRFRYTWYSGSAATRRCPNRPNVRRSASRATGTRPTASGFPLGRVRSRTPSSPRRCTRADNRFCPAQTSTCCDENGGRFLRRTRFGRVRWKTRAISVFAAYF